MNKNRGGFTIIEVLIVIAIGALILLIVFLAVPALELNQRNVARKTEASRIIAAIQNFITNGGGVLPSCSTYPCNSHQAGTDPATIMAEDNFQYITQLELYYGPGTGTHTLQASLTEAHFQVGWTCGAYINANTYVTVNPGPTDSIILVFGIETSSGGTIVDCLQS